MTKRAILLSTLLLAACAAFAQYSSGYGSQDSSPSTQSSGGNETFRGCLSKEGPEYYLTTLGANQDRYELTGDTTKLAAHVGHEISVTGSVQNTGPASQGSTTSGDNTASGTILLQKFHHISVNCPE
jgi:hypothetical protein